MDALCAAAFCNFNQAIDNEVALARGPGPNAVRFMAHPNMQRVRVGVGIDGDGPKPKPFRSACDTAGNLTTVGNKD
jgi:hypothetical protein